MRVAWRAKKGKTHFILLINYDIATTRDVQFGKKKGHIDRPMAELLTHTHSHTHMWRRKHEKVPGDKINLCIRNELRDTQGASSQQQQQDNNNSNNNHTMGTGCHLLKMGNCDKLCNWGNLSLFAHIAVRRWSGTWEEEGCRG